MTNNPNSDAIERVGRLLLDLRMIVHPLTQQDEGRIWRAAEKACAIIDKIETALAKPATVMGDDAAIERELIEFEGSDALSNGDFSVCNRSAARLQQLSAEVSRLKQLLRRSYAFTDRRDSDEANAFHVDVCAALSQPNEGTG